MTVPSTGISQPKDDNRFASDNATISDDEKDLLKMKLVAFWGVEQVGLQTYLSEMTRMWTLQAILKCRYSIKSEVSSSSMYSHLPVRSRESPVMSRGMSTVSGLVIQLWLTLPFRLKLPKSVKGDMYRVIQPKSHNLAPTYFLYTLSNLKTLWHGKSQHVLIWYYVS